MSSDSPFDAFEQNDNQQQQDEHSQQQQQHSLDDDLPLDQPEQDDELQQHQQQQQINSPSSTRQQQQQQLPVTNENSDPQVALGDAFASSSQQNSASVSASQIDEDTPLSRWEAERAQILAQRAAKAQKAKEQQQKDAKEEIAKFYSEQAKKLEQRKTTNRGDEKAYKSDMAKTLGDSSSGANQWEKVAKLCNTSATKSTSAVAKESSLAAGEKSVSNAATSAARTERFRKLLLQLKQQPKAAAASGKAK